MSAKKLFLETFGCQMNVVDSEKIRGQLASLGYGPVESAEEADIILLNTCSVRDKAERKVYGHLGSFKPLKERRPNLILGVGGCVAQQEGEKMLEQLPFLDLVFGTHNIHRLAEMVQEIEVGRGQKAAVDFLDAQTRLQLFPDRSEEQGLSSFVTIMQGCDNFCTYCIVPHVRGREISRPADEIIAEIEGLASRGVVEITLLGQNVNSYGNGGEAFASLLRRVNAIEGIERIRFMTSHPKDLSDALIEVFATLPKLCPHLHLPVQAGSSRILKEMNRGYSREEYLERVRKLKAAAPAIRLTADIIVGFPGETEAEFEETLEVIAEVEYADIFTFLYSPRPGTAAAGMVDNVSAKEKQARFDRLLALQEEISERVWGTDLGQVQKVLVEGTSKRAGQVFGRTVWNRIVNFSGPESLIGTQVPVRITRVNRNSHTGVLVD